jgi:hypothetical protein
MSTDRNENLMRAAFAPARSLEPSQADVARVLARVNSPARRPLSPADRGGWRRLAAPGLAALVLLASGLYAVPATRAAIDQAAGTFAGWVSGDSADAPGRPLGVGEQAPNYFYDHHFAREPRVIAEAGGYKLFAYIEPSGGLGFDLGDTGVGMGIADPGELEDHALYVLGPGAMQTADDPGHPARQLTDPEGHVPLFGIAARAVASVELTYESGPPLAVDGIDGGFVLLARPSRGPREVVAFDAEGNVIGRQPIDDSPHSGPQIDWRDYVPLR